MQKYSFRLFCNEKWYEHKDEILVWTGSALTEYDSAYYFRQHKWLLRKMYKEQRNVT
jgi:hypothetical protein